jgi:hypothetical protein
MLSLSPPSVLVDAGGVTYLAITSPIMCAATLGVCAVLWSITLLYGEYARRTQKIFQDTLACGNQVWKRLKGTGVRAVDGKGGGGGYEGAVDDRMDGCITPGSQGKAQVAKRCTRQAA